ncbi:MAG TPA: methyltransferase [Phenylobacterium sp.]|jgi:predicted methyltransferase
MIHIRTATFVLSLALATAAMPAIAQQAAAPKAPQDALTDPSLKGPEVIAFIGVKPGDKVADVVGARFTRALSQAVGPKGKLYAVETAEIAKTHPEAVKGANAAAEAAVGHNIVVSTTPVNAMDLPKGLDAVFIRQNYHDLYDKFMGPADVPAFNKQVYDALRPGGVYVILDHSAVKGAPMTVTETLHRIDRDRVVADVTKAGFKLDKESQILANPADPRDKMVFDPSIHGKTDQFLLRFRKPK